MKNSSAFFIRSTVFFVGILVSGAIALAQADNSPTTGTTGPPTQDQIIQRAGNINNQPVGNTTGPPTPTQVQSQSGTNNTSTATGAAAGSASSSTASGGSYTPIEDVPGFEGQTQAFPQYVRSIYILSMWLAGISALLMITVGGFWYMTSAGNTSRTGKAKGIITDAIIGLVLMLTAWLILNTINPDLTSITLSGAGGVSSVTSSGGGSASTPATSGTQGNCGGMTTNVGNQCDLVSGDLNSLMTCMAKNGAAGTVESVTSRNVGNNLAKSKQCCSEGGTALCPHAKGSCHAGCASSTPGYSQALDYATAAGASDDSLCKIADTAWGCGAGAQVWGPRNIKCTKGNIRYWDGHQTHLHIPTAQCNH